MNTNGYANIVETSSYKNAYKELKNKHRDDVIDDLNKTIEKLAKFEISSQSDNHPLKGIKINDIHIRGDVILLYRYVDKALIIDLRLEDVVNHKQLNNPKYKKQLKKKLKKESIKLYVDDKLDYDNEDIKEPTPTKIEYWYDKISKNWITQLFDENNYEIKNEYSGNKQDAIFTAKEWSKEYNIPFSQYKRSKVENINEEMKPYYYQLNKPTKNYPYDRYWFALALKQDKNKLKRNKYAIQLQTDDIEIVDDILKEIIPTEYDRIRILGSTSNLKQLKQDGYKLLSLSESLTESKSWDVIWTEDCESFKNKNQAIKRGKEIYNKGLDDEVFVIHADYKDSDGYYASGEIIYIKDLFESLSESKQYKYFAISDNDSGKYYTKQDMMKDLKNFGNDVEVKCYSLKNEKDVQQLENEDLLFTWKNGKIVESLQEDYPSDNIRVIKSKNKEEISDIDIIYTTYRWDDEHQYKLGRDKNKAWQLFSDGDKILIIDAYVNARNEREALNKVARKIKSRVYKKDDKDDLNDNLDFGYYNVEEVNYYDEENDVTYKYYVCIRDIDNTDKYGILGESILEEDLYDDYKKLSFKQLQEIAKRKGYNLTIYKEEGMNKPIYYLDDEDMSLRLIRYILSHSDDVEDNKIEEDLSQAQQDYFKDSKVRDKDGNLLVVYHGTPNPGFKEFNPKDNKSQFGKYKFGKYNVNYFTKDKKSATSYTEIGIEENDNVYACYLNIVNPYIVNNTTEAEMKSSFNIKDNRLREKEIQLFEKIFNKWKNKMMDYSDFRFKELNNDLKKINLELRPSDIYKENTDPEDIEYFDLYTLGNNSFFGAEHPIFYQYSIDEIFSDNMYDKLRDMVIGELDDYFLSTDDIVRYVILLNEEDGENYDGIIIPDIIDSKEMFSNITTDYITLISPNQIKLIDNENPTSSNRIDEKILNEVYPNKGESKKDFISRFMKVTKDEYPDRKQRFAVCMSYWNRRNKKIKESLDEILSKDIRDELFDVSIEDFIEIANIKTHKEPTNKGPLYLLKNGEFIYINDYADTHLEFIKNLINAYITKKYSKEYPDFDVKDDIYLIYTLMEVLEHKGLIRLNTGSSASDKRFYASLPHREDSKPTPAQYYALQDFLDLCKDDFQLYCGKKFQKYSDIIPENIIKKIKRYYTSGELYENLDENIDLNRNIKKLIDELKKYDIKLEVIKENYDTYRCIISKGDINRKMTIAKDIKVSKQYLDYLKDYMDNINKNLNEKLLKGAGLDVFYTDSPYQARDYIIHNDKEYRCFVNSNQNVYLFGDAYDCIHRQMFNLAKAEGYLDANIASNDFYDEGIAFMYVPHHPAIKDGTALLYFRNNQEMDTFKTFELYKLLTKVKKIKTKIWEW